MRQDEIWMANLNPKIGTEAGKVRPVVIVQTDFLNSIHPSTIICPLTSQTQQMPNPLRVNLAPNKLNGLEKKSDIMIDQIRAIDNQRLVVKVGTIDYLSASQLREKLKMIMDL
jgi:mRNA interferase MazF